MGSGRGALVVAGLLLTFAWPAGGAGAPDATLRQPIWFQWRTASLDVLILPPGHGQVFNDHGVLNGLDPQELHPTANSYLRAVEDSVRDWNAAIGAFGAAWLKAGLTVNVYVVGRDAVPAAALLDPEIVVLADEHKGFILGMAALTPFVQACVVDNSKFFLFSFTYADMYNVNGQEYGHCLGLAHVAEPTHDVMHGTYRHFPGEAGTPLHCMSNLNVKGLEVVFSLAVLREPPAANEATLDSAQYKTLGAAGKAGCEL